MDCPSLPILACSLPASNPWLCCPRSKSSRGEGRGSEEEQRGGMWPPHVRGTQHHPGVVLGQVNLNVAGVEQ